MRDRRARPGRGAPQDFNACTAGGSRQDCTHERHFPRRSHGRHFVAGARVETEAQFQSAPADGPIVAASLDDPLARFERMSEPARAWGSRLVNIGSVGHLNPASGFGEWPQAMALIETLAADGSCARPMPDPTVDGSSAPRSSLRSGLLQARRFIDPAKGLPRLVRTAARSRSRPRPRWPHIRHRSLSLRTRRVRAE